MHSEQFDVIEAVRDSIVELGFPLRYPDERWEEAENVNCLAYVLNSIYGDLYVYRFFEKRSYIFQIYHRDEVINIFEDKLKLFGISFFEVTLFEKIPETYYRVAICRASDFRDFHFARQNADGIWSHKMGWYKPPELLCEANENPDEYLRDLGYDLITYYAIEKLE